MEVRGTMDSVREVPQRFRSDFSAPKWNCLLSHSSLMSMCVANVQLLAEVLCLSSTPAQGSKCRGNRFCPSLSCVPSRVLKVLLHLGGGGVLAMQITWH